MRTLRAILALCLWVVIVNVSQAAEDADLFEQAQDAASARNHARVISCLQEFLKGSVGDDRIEQAKAMLQKTYEVYAGRLAKDGFAAEAAKQYEQLARLSSDSARAKRAEEEAKAALRNGLAMSRKARRQQEALQLAAEWEVLFREEPALLADADRLQLKVELLSAQLGQKAEPEYLLASLAEVYEEKEAEVAMQGAKLSRFAVELACAQRYASRGWNSAALSLFTKLELSAPDELERKKVRALMVESLLDRAEAWVAMGNVAQSRAAIAECEKCEGMPERHPRLVKIKRAAGRLPASAEPKLIAFKEPIPGEASWSDDGGGLRLQDEVRMGIMGGDKADVSVQAGAVIEGGRLWVEHGKLSLQGLPDRPIILRGVDLVCEYIGEIEAVNVIFEDCTFAKGGRRYWVDNYSSRWRFENCLVVRSSFKALGYDYGMQFLNSTFYDYEFPKRDLNKPTTIDLAAKFVDDGNDVQDCTFIRCRMSPSATWMTKRSNFFACDLMFVPDTFRSTESLEVALFAPAADEQFRQELLVNSTWDDRGELLLTFAGKSFPMPSQRGLWQYLSPPREQKPVVSEAPAPARAAAMLPETPTDNSRARARSRTSTPIRSRRGEVPADTMVTDILVSSGSDMPPGYELLGLWSVDAAGKDTSGRECRQMRLLIKREGLSGTLPAITDFRVLGSGGELRPPAAGEATVASWDVLDPADTEGKALSMMLVVRRGGSKFAITDVDMISADVDEQPTPPSGFRVVGSWEADGVMGAKGRRVVWLCVR